MNPIGFVSEMVYPTYTKADTYSLAVLRRARINSFGSPLVLFIPGPNIIFLNSSMNLQQVSISKFEKLWLMVPKLSNRGCRDPLTDEVVPVTFSFLLLGGIDTGISN